MTGIVVGVDGSKDADAALRWALREGAMRSVSVTAVVACGPDDCPDALADHVHGDAERLAAAAHQAVEDALARVASPDAGTVELVELPVAADPVVALVEASAAEAMLVVGHRGAGRLRRLLAGSVSSGCLHQATGPVVVVREEALPVGWDGGPNDGLTGGPVGVGTTGIGTTGIGGPAPVVVGVDGSGPSVVALRWAQEAARVRGTSLRVLHAWSPVPSSYTGFYVGAGGGFDSEVVEKVAANVLDESLRLAFPAGGPDVPTEAVLAVGSAARGLVEASEQAQLVVVGARGGGGFTELLLGSTSHQVVHHASCPVAVLRDDAVPAG